MSDKSWILTDCFDTVLIRINSADTVKRKWAKKVSILLNFVISNSDLYEIRRSVERCLQLRCINGEFRGDELFSQIANRIGIVSNIELESTFLVDLMVEAEYESEVESLEVNSNLISELRKQEKPMAIVSDYHMSGDFLKKVFHHFQIDNLFERYFTSSDARCNKHSGELYSYVLDKLSIQGKQACMYGDTKKSDVDNAEAKGIAAILVNNKKLYKDESIKDVIGKLKKVMIQNLHGVDSFANYGAALYLVIDRLYRQCISRKIKHIFFLSREGEMLKILFDSYVKNHGGDFSSHYLYVSRRATVLSSLKQIEYEDFSTAGSIFNNQSLQYFFNTLSFSEEECEELKAQVNCDFNTPVDRFAESKELQSLKNNLFFRKTYDKKVEILRERFKKYLRQELFYESNQVALVDVGWNGTIQDSICSFCNEHQKVYGFYIGVCTKALVSPESQKIGLLFSEIYGKTHNFNEWSFDLTFFERILSASHGATLGYADASGVVIPILKEYETETCSYRMLVPIQKKIVAIFNEIDWIILNSPYTAEDAYSFFLEIHIKTLLTLSISKAKFQQKLYENQVENFSSGVDTKQQNRNVFGPKQIILKAIPKIKTLKNTEIMIKILAQNNMYFFIPIFSYLKKHSLLKKIK